MDSVYRGLFRQLWQPQKNVVRTCNKIVVQKPRPRHFIRAQVEELVKPRYPRKIDPSIPIHELCQGSGQKNIIEENRYEELLGKDLLENVFKKHRYIFFFHRNSMTVIEELDMKVLMKHCGLVMRIRPKGCVQKAFTGTIYEPTLILFASHTFLGFGNEVDLKKMLASLRKTKLVLMAGLIDNRLLSVNEIEKYSKLPDLTQLRASLVSVLNLVAGNVVHQLNHHPGTLVQHLKKHVEISENQMGNTSSSVS